MTGSIAVKVINGFTLREDPCRESCFTIAQTDEEMISIDDLSSPEGQRERLHRHMNNELGTMEIAAQTLVDFPDVPWELRMELARQTYDETRHVTGLYRRLQELGGHKGEFPIGNFEWCVTTMQDNMPARLAIQNRTFEAGEMDLLAGLSKRWRKIGDEKTAQLLESILVDEVGHVRFANRWLKQMIKEDSRVLLNIARAMHFLSEAIEALSPPIEGRASKLDVHNNPLIRLGINIDDRRNAEFSDEEINEILRQSGMRSLTETTLKTSITEARTSGQ
jgi:uncharacterized ferritin-like protein (DUF455 family)